MFELIFCKRPIARGGKIGKSEFSLTPVAAIRPLKWEEHCLECAPPACYHQCPNYLKRSDGSCIRLSDGLRRDLNFEGRNTFGIHCKFRIWSKLEALYIPISIPPLAEKIFSLLEHGIIILLYLTSKLLNDWRFLAWGSCYWSKFLLKLNWFGRKNLPDFFWIEADLLERNETPFRLQVFRNDEILYTNVLPFHPGHNAFSIPFNALNIRDNMDVRIFLSPMQENPAKEVEVVFQWLELVCLKSKCKPSSHVKCVIWDMDNTLYEGVLSEDGPEKLKRKNDVEKLIKTFDASGIINTICSKNDFEPARNLLRQWGLWEYFVAPEINWNPKSINIRKIAKRLNLGLDAFAFVDDNPTERLEVRTVLPEVRIYSENMIALMTLFPEFSTGNSEMGKERRLSYQAEARREDFLSEFSGQYDDFLRSLKMTLQVSPVIGDRLKKRCYELLMRSNQLNLTTHRYSEDEFHKLISDNTTMTWAFSCGDRFGDYGIVGFASAKLHDEEAMLTDLVISCRVARKKAESAMVFAAASSLAEKGVRVLNAELLKTKKNGPLATLFEQMPFRKLHESDKSVLFQLDLSSLTWDPSIITITQVME